MARTYTITRKIRGAERLLWQDANASGLSDFGIRVLRFIAQEAAFGGSFEQSFLAQLKEWPKKFQGECSWKSAGALGVIWWGQDMNRLWQLANTWARSNDPQDWQRAAALLDGAYEVERNELGEDADQPNKSSVLRQVSLWVKETHSSSETNVGCAAAHTYGKIGQRSPEHALRGLGELLRFPQSSSGNNNVNVPLDVFVSGVLGYVTLTWSGHIRDVLAHLATSVDQLSHQRRVLQETGERRQYNRQRMVSLAAIFDAFFLIAASSLTANQENSPTNYSSSNELPLFPALPDESGRDVLLAGILAGDVEFMWNGQNAAILCAVIVEGNDKPAFDLMRQWAEIVLKQRDLESQKIREAYVHFLVSVGREVTQWCDDLKNSGYRPLPAVEAYKRRLKLWQSDSRLRQSPLGDLAQEVLQQLDD